MDTCDGKNCMLISKSYFREIFFLKYSFTCENTSKTESHFISVPKKKNIQNSGHKLEFSVFFIFTLATYICWRDDRYSVPVSYDKCYYLNYFMFDDWTIPMFALTCHMWDLWIWTVILISCMPIFFGIVCARKSYIRLTYMADIMKNDQDLSRILVNKYRPILRIMTHVNCHTLIFK